MRSKDGGSFPAATPVDVPTGWDLQQRRPLPAAETGRSCWGSGQQDARPLQGPLQTLGAATRDTKKEPTGLFFAAYGRPCSFDSSYGLHDPATTVDVPTGWDPRTKQQSTGLLFATYRWPCCSIPVRVMKKSPERMLEGFYDPYGNRTHVTAVKGPCLNRLTNGPYIIQDFAKTASNLSATIATDPQVF